jgi:hypothetical protein
MFLNGFNSWSNLWVIAFCISKIIFLNYFQATPTDWVLDLMQSTGRAQIFNMKNHKLESKEGIICANLNTFLGSFIHRIDNFH